MTLTSIAAGLGLIAILVLIHEFGHYIVAKACGVGVPIFSIGFGRRLFGVKVGGTDYRLSLLPFGGYVRLAGADPFGYTDDEDEMDESKSFRVHPLWQRVAVMAAGPLFNLLLPVLLFTILLMAGQPQDASDVGIVDNHSPAAAAGVQAGDHIKAVDGVAVQTWADLADSLVSHGQGPVKLDLDRNGSDVHIEIPASGAQDPDSLGLEHERLDTRIGVYDPKSPAGRAGLRTGDAIVAVDGQPVSDWLGAEDLFARDASKVDLSVKRDGQPLDVTVQVDPSWTPLDIGNDASARWGIETASLYIGSVIENVDSTDKGLLDELGPQDQSPALASGLQQGDRFLRMGGKPVSSWGDVLFTVHGTMVGQGQTATASPLAVDVMRDGEVKSLTLSPVVVASNDQGGHVYYRPVLGVTRLGGMADGGSTRVYYPLVSAFPAALDETARLDVAVVGLVWKLVTHQASVKESLGGPVEMFREAKAAAERGLFYWAQLMGGLSISLGIMNLLPIPLLDGGQIVIDLLEGLRGRPMSIALRERVQQVGLLFLVLLMLFVLVSDIQRWHLGPG